MRFLALCFLGLLWTVAAADARQQHHRPDVGEVRSIAVEVAAPPSAVYPYLTDEDLIERWNVDSDVTVTFPRGRETRVGKQIRVELDLPTRPWILMEIVELSPDRRVVTAFVDGALTGTFAYDLTATPTGCRVVHTMDVRGVGLVYRVAWGLIGRRLHERKMRTFLTRMARLVERDASVEGAIPAR